MELGCDARGFSRAGNDTLTWYCLVLVGRAGRTMAQMREVSLVFLDICRMWLSICFWIII